MDKYDFVLLTFAKYVFWPGRNERLAMDIVHPKVSKECDVCVCVCLADAEPL